jgi:TonB family protein
MLQSRLSRLFPLCLAAAFICVVCFPLHAEEAEALKLPKVKDYHGQDSWYPAPAQRLGQQGRVLVEFKISSKGRVVDLRIASAEPQGVFDSTVKKYMRALEFDVPGDWEASGGTNHKFHFGFVFRLQSCPGAVSRVEPVPFPADYRHITVTGSAICLTPRAKHTTQTEADRVYCEYMREQGGSPASCAKP